MIQILQGHEGHLKENVSPIFCAHVSGTDELTENLQYLTNELPSFL